MMLNFVGILLAALNVWVYARKYTGALVLGNLFTAILIRNELFGRILYLIINTIFAKVGFTRANEPVYSMLTHILSGLLYGFDLAVLQSFNTWAGFTPVVRCLASSGLYSRSLSTLSSIG